jgi:hypothetical protein
MTDTLNQLAQQMTGLFKQAIAAASEEVASIIQSRDQNPQRIEHQLDHMLGFCCDPEMLALYKQLCRYYFALDATATADYIDAYRKMWDSGDGV